MKIALVTFKSNGKRVNIPLRSKTVTIGRGPKCQVRVPAASVSREHCELIIKNSEVRVKDLDSANGTFVNGDKVVEVQLGAGDLLRAGQINFMVQINGEPAEIAAFSAATDEPDLNGPALDDSLVAAAAAGSQAPPESPPEEPLGAEDATVDVEDIDAEVAKILEADEEGADDTVGNGPVSLDANAKSGKADDPLSALEELQRELEEDD